MRADGQRSQELGPQRQLSGARLQEPVRRRRRAVRHAGRQESHVDHSRAGVAHLGLHRAAAQGRYPVTDINRRDALKELGAAPLAGLLDWSPASMERATRHLATLTEDSGAAAATKFFTAHEWKTVRVLADLVIPPDERSGSATDAKAPEVMAFMLAEKDTSESSKGQMPGGLPWLAREVRRRFGTDFLASSHSQRPE